MGHRDDRLHEAPDPFEEMDRIDAARKEEAGLKGSSSTGIGIHRSGPLGILPTRIWGRMRKVFGGRFRMGKKAATFEAPVAPGTRPLFPENTEKRD